MAAERNELLELTLFDLERAQRLITQLGAELDPQFRIATPDGDYWIAVTLPDGSAEREKLLGLLSDFMSLKRSLGFVMAAEIHELPSVIAIGVTSSGSIGVTAAVSGSPRCFGEVKVLRAEDVDPGILALLPDHRRSLSEERLAEIEAMFGSEGVFPAIRIRGSSPKKADKRHH